MHNLKSIRENPDIFKKKILDRNVDINLKELLELDKNNRETIQKKEKLEQEKKKYQNLKTKLFLKSQKKFLMKLIY